MIAGGSIPSHPKPRRDKKALRCSRFMTLSRKVICPSSAVREFLSSPGAKNKLLFKIPKSVASLRHPVPQEGRSRSSRTLGWDAVDAAASGAIVSQGEPAS